ncbi:transcriptional regulator/sugar kinase [Sphaerochaeta pleomorpha str. Grapes]|uniref:Transcriptional regulator/sugar kinase n=1 Tax=Sphaerochaeta pleomorpha (strain ATCC BAA-1885 / DSM 22778 / Grapes) TaxID=158190 RepID=G8QXI6_SPHPG|nr:ROK family protein [Sphaerochaeta pleomorpha]AEV29549.1 transcriptional regulator/sugar kinase [Sphaerochaeta pleomorpha str. Grapes]
MKNYLSIDIGGSKLLVGIVNDKGEILEVKKLLLVNPNQDSILHSVYSLCDMFFSRYHIDCIGVSIPGLADPVTGVWLEAVFSKVKNFPLGKLLSDRYKIEVFIENDANNCAYGEKLFGCAKLVNDFIWLTVSNGCGSGIFLNGKLFTGAGSNAGELGHIFVTNKKYKCPCGNFGCLESVAAGPGIVRRYIESSEKVISRSITAKDVADFAKAGDKNAIQVYQQTGDYLGRAIAASVNVLNVPLVVIGGGITLDSELFMDSLISSVDSHIYRTANQNLQIKITEMGYYASLIGAISNAIIQDQKPKI